jgi:hypothetical protein
MMTERRRKTDLTPDEVLQIAAEATKRALADHQSLRKNGDTFWGWLGRIVSPERVMILVVLLYQLGGSVTNWQRRVEGAEQVGAGLQQQVATIQTEVTEMRTQLRSLEAALRTWMETRPPQ